MDMAQLMQMAGQLKEQLGSAQEAASKLQATAESGGGLVKVTVAGQHRVQSLQIDPSLLTPDGKELLEDLVMVALNQANERLAAAVQGKMGGVAEGFGIDPSAFAGLGG